MSIKRKLKWIEQVASPENVAKVALIYGAIMPFDGKIGAHSVSNEAQSIDYDKNAPQSVGFVIYEKGGQPDDGWYVEVYDDETVTVDYLYTWVNEAEGTRERYKDSYKTTFRRLLNWMLAGCDLDTIIHFIDSVE